MKRLLIAGRLDGKHGELSKLESLVRDRRPEGVLFAGGILGTGSDSHAEKLKAWKNFFEVMGKFDVFTAVVPGLSDLPLRLFLRMAMEAEVASPNLHVAHATLFEEGDVAINGLGGDLTEAEDHCENRLCSARSTAEYFLRTLWRAEQPHKVLLLSVPPPGQLGGETGNRICGDFIDSYHPSLCVVAGTTERRGVQRIAHTFVVNPGRLADGSVAWLDWKRNKDDQVEFLKT
jgi:Icc-related predicted phosphoesterase